MIYDFIRTRALEDGGFVVEEVADGEGVHDAVDLLRLARQPEPIQHLPARRIRSSTRIEFAVNQVQKRNRDMNCGEDGHVGGDVQRKGRTGWRCRNPNCGSRSAK